MSRQSMIIAGLSTVVEWCDFTLYLYFATVLSRVFFGAGSSALLTTLGGFGIAYLMRPIGAAVFGHVGDRHGRRAMLLATMALMSAAMLLTALLPTYTPVGPAAGCLMLLLRCVMGFSVGGEYPGVVAYLLEGAAAERRGLVTSPAAVMVILVTPLVGSLSDRLGRKPGLVLLCGCAALLPGALFAWMGGGDFAAALTGALVLAMLGGAVSAVGAVATAEQFPGEGRLTGLALGATTATAIFGGIAPYAAQLMIERLHAPAAPGIMIAVLALGALPVIAAMPETASCRRKTG